MNLLTRRSFTLWWTEESGSVAAETALLAPILILLLVLVAIVIHRGVDTRLRLADAAYQAARAASLTRSMTAARAAADTSARQALATAGVTCRDLSIRADVTGFAAGGSVTVTVSCTVDLTEATFLAGTGSRVESASATEPVDTYRSTEAGS